MKMTTLVAGATLLVVGYFAGFYEVKYKTLKAMLDSKFKEETKQNEEDTKQ